MKYSYKDFECLTDTVVSVLASGKFPVDDADKMKQYLKDTHDGDRVIAGLMYPTIDVELEAWTSQGAEPCYASETDDEISLAYFVCIKGKMHTGEIEWTSGDYIPREVNVDFSADNWEEQLERDMIDALEDYVKAESLSYTELNFNDYE